MVARSSSQTEVIEQYREKFPKSEYCSAHNVTAQGRSLDVRVSGDSNVEYLGVFDGGELVAVMSTWEGVEEVPYRHIGKTIVAPLYRGHRIIRQLIEWSILDRHQCIASDENQTHEGARVWESMIMREPVLSFSLWWP
ncbi:MAG: GNAT family N-acetyltransferase, partial [Pontixanthobacter sp.]